MSVDVSLSDLVAAAALPRAEGAVRLVVERAAGQTVAGEIEEAGPLRVRFPRVAAGDALEGVLVNTGGGIVGGDRLEVSVAAGEGARVALTTQAAEKVYRSTGPAARIATRLEAGPGAALNWVPQETILFDRAKLERTIDADVSPAASLTICEAVVFGRTAMGERLRGGALRDRWRIRRNGRLVFADALSLDGPIAGLLARPAIAGGAAAAATLVQAAADSESRLDAVRSALAGDGVEAGASAFDGLLVVRMIARDGFALRAAVLAVLTALGAPPPRAFSL